MNLKDAKIVGFFSLPSQSLAEHNPSAYSNAMRDMPSGAGSCGHCGTGIMHHVVIQMPDGSKAFIGTTCAEKVGCDKVRACIRERITTEEYEAREAERMIRFEKKQAERKAMEEAQAVKDKAVCKVLVEKFGKTVLEWIAEHGYEYLSTLAGNILKDKPQDQYQNPVRWKQVHLMADFHAKGCGRRNSKAYNEAYELIEEALIPYIGEYDEIMSEVQEG